MASIVKRGKHYCVVYNYQTEKGDRKQKWESYRTKAEAEQILNGARREVGLPPVNPEPPEAPAEPAPAEPPKRRGLFRRRS